MNYCSLISVPLPSPRPDPTGGSSHSISASVPYVLKVRAIWAAFRTQNRTWSASAFGSDQARFRLAASGAVLASGWTA